MVEEIKRQTYRAFVCLWTGITSRHKSAGTHTNCRILLRWTRQSSASDGDDVDGKSNQLPHAQRKQVRTPSWPFQPHRFAISGTHMLTSVHIVVQCNRRYARRTQSDLCHVCTRTRDGAVGKPFIGLKSVSKLFRDRRRCLMLPFFAMSAELIVSYCII